MPSSPVAASNANTRRWATAADAAFSAVSTFPSGIASDDAKVNAMPAHSRLSAAHTAAVRVRPNSGTSQKAAASTPMTAPSVLQA